MAAVTGAVVGIASTAMSASQAGAAAKEKRQAQRDAQRLTAEAEAQINLNPFEEMSVRKGDIDLRLDVLNEQIATKQKALAEADVRYASAGAGKDLMLAQRAARGIAGEYGQRLDARERAILGREEKSADLMAQLRLGQAEGAQRAAAQAEQVQQQATMSAIQSGIGTLATIGSGIEAYGRSAKGELGALGSADYTADEIKSLSAQGIDVAQFKDMSVSGKGGYRQFRRNLTPQQRQSLYTTPSVAAALGAQQQGIAAGQLPVGSEVAGAVNQGAQTIGQGIQNVGQGVGNFYQNQVNPFMQNVGQQFQQGGFFDSYLQTLQQLNPFNITRSN